MALGTVRIEMASGTPAVTRGQSHSFKYERITRSGTFESHAHAHRKQTATAAAGVLALRGWSDRGRIAESCFCWLGDDDSLNDGIARRLASDITGRLIGGGLLRLGVATESVIEAAAIRPERGVASVCVWGAMLQSWVE